MDNSKIHDTGLYNRNNKSLMGFLKQKGARNGKTSFKPEVKRESKYIRPTYIFTIVSYSIGSHVEYLVQMEEIYGIFGEKKVNKYMFKTRYSLLEKLNEVVKSPLFPPKKIFGNSNVKFVEKRKKDLENFLNSLSKGRNEHF